MIGALQIAPYVLVVALAGAGYHVFTVWQKDQVIADLELAQVSLKQEVTTLREANGTQKQTIDTLLAESEEQREEAQQLSREKNQLVRDRDEYVSIFRRHDLTKLARAKPGLIEPRINDGTREVLEGLESLTEIPQ